MRPYLVFYVIVLLSLFKVTAQKIHGIVLDENLQPIEYASVVLLNQFDSTVIHFKHSNRKGEFEFSTDKKSNLLLQISYLGYEQFWLVLHDIDKDTYLDSIVLKTSSHLLEEIEVKDFLSPMSFGKDTIQYNASAFKVKPGDVAEDLLRKLPGIEVERDGSVKALGEKVENVLVDGKEFFGKDTKIATKNLDADAIDKVQVFDRKSDKSEFTGIDDGQRERSINLKLKEDKKVGYFGTTEIAAGSSKRIKCRANLNRFTPNLRSSFIGMANNINEQNFSIRDYIDFMGGMGSFMNGGGSGGFTIDLDQNAGLPIGMDNNQGIQNSYAGGLNINKDFSKKSTIEASVFGNHFKNDLRQTSIRENLLTDRRFSNKNNDEQLSGNSSGSYSLRWKNRFDSSQMITIRSTGALGINFAKSVGQSMVYNNDLSLINDNQNTIDMADQMFRMNTNVLWQKKTRKPGRTYSFNGQINFTKNNSEGDISSTYRIFEPMLQTNDLLQNQIGLDDGFFYKTEGSYTEPLGKKQYLEF
ncbi:MAG: hypothetical protein IPM48_05000 [Saprospiraceae bacterium]|nr:hypothetical protein [Saprospiraceae bacterium]